MKETALVKEINYTEQIHDLRTNLTRAFTLRNIKKDYIPAIEDDQTSETNLKEHFKNNSFINTEADQIVEKNQHHSYISHYHSNHNNFFDVFDLAISFSKNYEESGEFLKIANKYYNLSNCLSPFSIFYEKLTQVFTETASKKHLSVSEILLEPIYDLDITRQQKIDDFYNQIITNYDCFITQLNNFEKGSLNQNHPSHKTFLKLQELSVNLMKTKSNGNEDREEIIKYFQRLYSYLKAFSKIFYIEKNNANLIACGKDVSYFEILNISKHELVGKLIFENNLHPSDFEQFFTKMKLDLSYHIAANCFPMIYLLEDRDEIYLKPLHKPSLQVLTYIQKRNWLLGFILNEIHKIEITNIDFNSTRLKYFLNYVKLPMVQRLMELYDNNEFVTALQRTVDCGFIEKYFNESIRKYDAEENNLEKVANLSTESCEEASEGFLRSTNWKHLFDIIDSIPQLQLNNSDILKDLRDMVLVNLVSERYEPEYYKYVQYIQDDDLRLNIIMCYKMYWPVQFCIDIMQAELTRFKPINQKYRNVMDKLCSKMKLYEKVFILLNYSIVFFCINYYFFFF